MIIYGPEYHAKRVPLSSGCKMVPKIIAELQEYMKNPTLAPSYLSKKCELCEYNNYCKERATIADQLSLLNGISEKEINRQNSRGIFTINQLSYTFCPRRMPKRVKRPSQPHYFALHALAIRENRIYIYGNPTLPLAKTQIFLDIEGLPDSQCYYLIVNNGTISQRSFCADVIDDNRTRYSKIFWTI